MTSPADETGGAEARAVNAVLDAFHAAAAAADEAGYLACLAPAAVFLGTAPGERWAGEGFRSFVRATFAGGEGWTYVPSDRRLSISADGHSAWFDESLENEWYGRCRGTGVLSRDDQTWTIAQYALSIPVPDEIAVEVVARIQEHDERTGT